MHARPRPQQHIRRRATPGLILACAPALLQAHAGPQPALLPVPAEATWEAGRLPLDPEMSVSLRGPADPRVDSALERFARHMQARHRVRVTRTTGASPTLEVHVRAAGPPVQHVGEDESYRLTLEAGRARLEAPGALGVLHGLETLAQLVLREQGRAVLPAAVVADRPRFPWRGLLLDPARRFLPVETVERTLDAMAAVKLNVLHWHLSDDQGFRVESRLFPALHEHGSDGRYYTQDEIRKLVAYARARGIRVVPEFDVPGHATSWLVGHPELGSAPGPFSLLRGWGIFDNALDPSGEHVYAFLDAFFGEMATLFPDEYVHVGGDEVTPRQWNANARILDFAYRHGLDDHRALQAHFNRRVAAILAGHGKKMVGWDEVLHPDLPGSALVQSWRGPEALAQAAQRGHHGILSHGYYLDHMRSAAHHYDVDPLPPGLALPEHVARRVLGGEACMWGEFVDDGNLDGRLWPRAAAIAERLWSPASLRDHDDLYRRLDSLMPRLASLGIDPEARRAGQLQRLAGSAGDAPLRLLAELVEPVKLYRRGQLRTHTSTMPLTRLVDVVSPESRASRDIERQVRSWLASAERDASALRARFSAWRDNHARLEPVLAAAELAAEARPLSRDLSALGRLGLDALETLQARQSPGPGWSEAAWRTLARSRLARAELELAVVPAVARLALAAERVAELEPLPRAEWNARLDAWLAARPELKAEGAH